MIGRTPKINTEQEPTSERELILDSDDIEEYVEALLYGELERRVRKLLIVKETYTSGITIQKICNTFHWTPNPIAMKSHARFIITGYYQGLYRKNCC